MTWVTWIIAVVCAAAVGARMGRLTVRPPSLSRTSVAVAAVAVALAAAVRTPTVAVILGPKGSDTPMLVFIGCWVVVATATTLIAMSAWPHMGRRPLHAATIAIPIAGVADLIAMGLTGLMSVGAVFVVVTGLFAVAVGVWYVAWHPLGRAIGLYLVGVLLVVFILATSPVSTEPAGGWWAAAIIVLSVACASVMVESWFTARSDLRRTRTLWQVLLGAHPELAADDYRSATTVLAANDRVSQILDGLYLHAGAGLVSSDSDDWQSMSASSRAAEIATWLHNTEPTPLDPDFLGTPVGFSDRRWIRTIAHEYDRAVVR